MLSEILSQSFFPTSFCIRNQLYMSLSVLSSSFVYFVLVGGREQANPRVISVLLGSLR